MTSPGKEELPSQTEAEPTLALPNALLCPWHTHRGSAPLAAPPLVFEDSALQLLDSIPQGQISRDPECCLHFSPRPPTHDGGHPGPLLSRRGETFKSLVPYTTLRSLSFPLLA